MLVDQWVETVWTVLNVREKTLRDYKHLYKNHLKPVIGLLEMDSVLAKGPASKTAFTTSTDTSRASHCHLHTTCPTKLYI